VTVVQVHDVTEVSGIIASTVTNVVESSYNVFADRNATDLHHMNLSTATPT
jgi:hypothetical protein